jgi:hypothetical protein
LETGERRNGMRNYRSKPGGGLTMDLKERRGGRVGRGRGGKGGEGRGGEGREGRGGEGINNVNT